jgi:hypothetical protein
MTLLLSKAVREIEQLPTEVQDSVAAVILEQIVSDENWEKMFGEQEAAHEMAA